MAEEYDDLCICEICGRKNSSQLMAEIRDPEEIKFAHMECCSIEQLKQCLLLESESQLKFYQDAIDLVDNLDQNRVRDFETKYGTFDELSQYQPIDRELIISALISELKKRMKMK
jgi:transcription elongation factor Elf1